MFKYIKKFGAFISGLIGFLLIMLAIVSIFYEGLHYGFAIVMLYLIFIAWILTYLGQKLGLWISKILFSLPTNFKPSQSESFIYAIPIFVVLAVFLQIYTILPLLPKWIPFYEMAHHLLQNFAMISISLVIAQIIVACRYKIFTKGIF